MAASVFMPPTPRKTSDAEIAEALGVSPRAVKSWRLNERPTPPDIAARLLRYRAERALSRIAAERDELANIIDEAAANDLDLATLVRRFLRDRRLLHETRASLRDAGGSADPGRDDPQGTPR